MLQEWVNKIDSEFKTTEYEEYEEGNKRLCSKITHKKTTGYNESQLRLYKEYGSRIITHVE